MFLKLMLFKLEGHVDGSERVQHLFVGFVSGVIGEVVDR